MQHRGETLVVLMNRISLKAPPALSWTVLTLLGLTSRHLPLFSVQFPRTLLPLIGLMLVMIPLQPMGPLAGLRTR